jgi:general secretion pathway protein N
MAGDEMIRLSTRILFVAASLASGAAAAQTPIGVGLREQGRSQTSSSMGQRPVSLTVPAQEPASNGNPLWGIPLSALTVTHERPIFSSTRRPPPVAVAAPVIQAPPPPLEAAEPEHPLFALVGTVMGETEKQAIFMDQASNLVVRLHVGEAEAGWVLRSIDARATTLEKNSQRVILELPVPDATSGSQLGGPPQWPSGPGAQPADRRGRGPQSPISHLRPGRRDF